MKEEINVKLLAAARRGDLNTVRILLNKGANVNARDRHGETALIWASAIGNIKLVKLLINKGANVTIFDKEGYTAFRYADEQGYSKVAGLLKEKEIRSCGIYLSRLSINYMFSRT